MANLTQKIGTLVFFNDFLTADNLFTTTRYPVNAWLPKTESTLFTGNQGIVFSSLWNYARGRSCFDTCLDSFINFKKNKI